MNGYIDIKITVTDAQGVVLLETDTQKRHAELLEKGNLSAFSVPATSANNHPPAGSIPPGTT